jgi:hypothetical protein
MVPPVAGLRSLAIDPQNAMLVIDGQTPATATYRAQGTFDDGHTEDVTNRVGFALADPGLASFAGPQLTSQIDHGGRTTVYAAAGMVQTSTTLTLALRERVGDPASPDLPSDPSSWFGGAVDPSRAPDLVYPNDGVLLPPNLRKLEVHFLPGAGNTLFELSFHNDLTDILVYLRCNPLASGCLYAFEPRVWHWIAETNRGGAPLAVSIRGTDGTAVGQSTPIAVAFSQDDLHGALYYWTTSNGTGIMRYDFGSATQTDPERFIGRELTSDVCVGCHALSRDGKKIVAEAGGQNDGRILLLDVATSSPMVPFAQPGKSIFESWNPDGSRYVGVYGDRGAVDFNLQLFDGATGARVGHIEGTGTADNPADHPDWSPDGQQIVYVKVGQAGTLQRMHQGAIWLTTDRGGVWSAPVELVPKRSDGNRYYPSFSPDGSMVVFDESVCMTAASTGPECDADTDPSARLYALKPMPGSRPVEFARANAPGKQDGGQTMLATSFPKWSPFVFQRTGELGTRLEWITFSSARQYGLRPPPPNGTQIPTGTLLWMAAVDPDKITTGSDPSYPAFALPFQDLTTSNHIAQWTTQIAEPPR